MYDPSKSFDRQESLRKYIKRLKKKDSKFSDINRAFIELAKCDVRMLDEIDECFDEDMKEKLVEEHRKFRQSVNKMLDEMQELLSKSNEEIEKTLKGILGA